MTSFPSNLRTYLRKRAISAPWKLEGRFRNNYDACIVIPALAESDTLPKTLKSLSDNPSDYLARTLIIVVINHRLDSAFSLQHDNEKTLQLLNSYPDDKLQLAWVDACSHRLELPVKQGVGLARKIGFDLGLSQLNWQAKPFLISLDADTLVDNNYLTALFAHFSASDRGAAVLPFRHSPAENPAHERAIRHYELYLRSYAYGLKLAGSPYAYTSIGSAFACTAEAYILAGGMNRRLAGEDFYFLQQLAKTTGIEEVRGGMVFPSARASKRVPFGTGRVVCSQTDEDIAPFTFCTQSAFFVLKEWLSLVNTHWQATSDEILFLAEDIDPQLRIFLKKLNLADVWLQLQNNHREHGQFIKNFHCWFDGLRSRQLLMSLTKADPGLELDSINELFRWGGIEEQNTDTDKLKTLEQLQGVLSK